MSNYDCLISVEAYLKLHEEYILIDKKENNVSGPIYDLVIKNDCQKDESEKVEILRNLFKVFGENNVSIRSLKTDECYLSDESVQLIIDNLINLNVIKLTLKNEEKISSQIFKNLFQILPKTKITELNFQGSTSFDATTLKTLIESYNNLEENENIALENLNLSEIDEKDLNILLNNLQEILQHPKCNIMQFIFRNYNLKEFKRILQKFIEILPHSNCKLQTLDLALGRCWNEDLYYYKDYKKELLDENIFDDLAKILKASCCKLNTINLANCFMTQVSIEILAAAVAYAKIYNKVEININFEGYNAKEVLCNYTTDPVKEIINEINKEKLFIEKEHIEHFNRIKDFKECQYIIAKFGENFKQKTFSDLTIFSHFSL